MSIENEDIEILYNTAGEREERITSAAIRLGTEKLLEEIGDNDGDFEGAIQLELQTKTEEELVAALKKTDEYNMVPEVIVDWQEKSWSAKEKTHRITLRYDDGKEDFSVHVIQSEESLAKRIELEVTDLLLTYLVIETSSGDPQEIRHAWEDEGEAVKSAVRQRLEAIIPVDLVKMIEGQKAEGIFTPIEGVISAPLVELLQINKEEVEEGLAKAFKSTGQVWGVEIETEGVTKTHKIVTRSTWPKSVGKSEGMAHLLKKRENGRSDKQLLKGVLFRAISGAASHLANYDPEERTGKLVIRNYQVPTEHLIFPELETYFSANERDGAEAVLSVKFHKSRKEKVGIIKRRIDYTPERRELSIYFGIPKKVCAFSIEDITRIQRKKLDIFPPIPMNKWRSISLDKWRSRQPFENGDLEIADLHSFWKSLEYALKKDDPQFLLQLEKRVLYA